MPAIPLKRATIRRSDLSQTVNLECRPGETLATPGRFVRGAWSGRCCIAKNAFVLNDLPLTDCCASGTL